MSLCEGLALRLEQLELVRYRASPDCFLERPLPQMPVQAVAIQTYGGPEPEGDLPYREVLVQVLVRGSADPVQAQSRAQAIHDALHGLGRVDLVDGDSTCLLSCFAQQAAPTPLGPDKGGHYEFSVNLLCEVVRDTEVTPLG